MGEKENAYWAELSKNLARKRRMKKTTMILLVVTAFFVLLMIIILLYYITTYTERKVGIGAEIEQFSVSPDGAKAYIKLSGGINNNKNIIKIKFIFKDVNDKEDIYETTIGINKIELPYSRSFTERILGENNYQGSYDYVISASSLGLTNLDNIKEVSVVFVYLDIAGTSSQTPVLDTKTITPTKKAGGGGGGGVEEETAAKIILAVHLEAG